MRKALMVVCVSVLVGCGEPEGRRDPCAGADYTALARNGVLCIWWCTYADGIEGRLRRFVPSHDGPVLDHFTTGCVAAPPGAP